MVMSHGPNGNMGYNIMNTDDEKTYRLTVKLLLESHEHYIHTVMYHRADTHTKKLAWLCLIGLIETSDMI